MPRATADFEHGWNGRSGAAEIQQRIFDAGVLVQAVSAIVAAAMAVVVGARTRDCTRTAVQNLNLEFGI